MELDPQQCYRAVSTRDRRYDGLFFTGVKTTGIFCRPVCPARTPLQKNVIFLRSAAEAQVQGFRPCRRCRPELAPETFVVNPSLRLALDRIACGYLNEHSVAELARSLRLSERHLRRLFTDEVGAAPSEVARNCRLQQALKLLTQTDLDLAVVAFASGFGSLRRFNETFRTFYGATPSEVRQKPARRREGVLTLRLAYRPPLDWQSLLDFLRPRALPGLEWVTSTYRRLQGPLVVEVQPLDDYLQVSIEGELKPSQIAGAVQAITYRVRRLFDLDLDPAALGAALGPAYTAVRVPGCWDPFECSVRAILGQQVSVAAATTLCGRLIAEYGSQGLFPSAETLSQAPLERQGLTSRRAQTLRELSLRVVRGLAFENALEENQLGQVPGVGPWTLGYLKMRVGRSPDAYPYGDLVLRRNLGGITAAQLEQRSQAWRPWRAYAAMAIWKGMTDGL